MCKVLIFGGTSEGRVLADYCHTEKIKAWISLATGYGKQMLQESPYLHLRDTPMDQAEMEVFIREKGIELVIDATHPYARLAGKNIEAACKQTKVKLLRLAREGKEDGWSRGNGAVISVASIEEGIVYLNSCEGNVLVTTGSKELALFTALEGWQERLFARVLPFSPVIAACEEMGIKGTHLIGMQGPFSVEMNAAMIRQHNICYLVTKESGDAGGFPEKLEAAARCGISVLVVERPGEEAGIGLEEGKQVLLEWKEKENEQKKRISLIGMGMGGIMGMTVAAYSELKACQVVFGSERMLTDISGELPRVLKIPYYTPGQILPWLEEHREWNRIGILYSGDTGFYSGAKGMGQALKQEPYQSSCEVLVFSGISSVSYLCAKLKTSWEDVKLFSLHGRDGEFLKQMENNSKLFVLLDGTNTVSALCRKLQESGYESVQVTVGERLSYADQRITAGAPGALLEQGMEFDSLAVVLIER